ncbi:lipoprotein [Superficieibacter electus]|uniref:Lipoprotein n=1 Tax=Superficieibacter electus TaxID=2022662 RepID=A0A2P5GRN6_9ENTR|nr:lipoprotein [Superficieibacter electus]POP45924.1 lipoprotein [Superficieibacter electus]POP49231.1 lipoprotein [Superficieibacter electus]
MRYSALALALPCALLLSACTTVTPAFKDIGTRNGPCVEGGPDTVAQKFYDARIQNRNNDITALRPYLSDDLAHMLSEASRDNSHNALLKSDPFSSRSTPPDSASVASASTIPNTDARNIPLRVGLKQGSDSWQDEVLMIREGQCWAVDDVRYLGGNAHAPAGTLRQSLEKR